MSNNEPLISASNVGQPTIPQTINNSMPAVAVDNNIKSYIIIGILSILFIIIIYYAYITFIDNSESLMIKTEKEDKIISDFNLKNVIKDLQRLQQKIRSKLSEDTGI